MHMLLQCMLKGCCLVFCLYVAIAPYDFKKCGGCFRDFLKTHFQKAAVLGTFAFLSFLWMRAQRSCEALRVNGAKRHLRGLGDAKIVYIYHGNIQIWLRPNQEITAHRLLLSRLSSTEYPCAINCFLIVGHLQSRPEVFCKPSFWHRSFLSFVKSLRFINSGGTVIGICLL